MKSLNKSLIEAYSIPIMKKKKVSSHIKLPQLKTEGKEVVPVTKKELVELIEEYKGKLKIK